MIHMEDATMSGRLFLLNDFKVGRHERELSTRVLTVWFQFGMTQLSIYKPSSFKNVTRLIGCLNQPAIQVVLSDKKNHYNCAACVKQNKSKEASGDNFRKRRRVALGQVSGGLRSITHVHVHPG